MLIQRSSLEGGENIILDKFLLQILNVDLLRPRFVCLIGDADELFLLSEVSGDGDDIRIIFFLEPFYDDRCVEAA